MEIILLNILEQVGNKLMIDLHIHSKYSNDGIDEISEILKQAESLKLKYISITDHNSCLSYNELKNKEIRNLYSGKIITGVELFTKDLGIPIEILGYNIDPLKMQELIEKTYPSNIQRNKIEVERLYKKCLEAGITLPSSFIREYDGTIFASKYLYKFLTQNIENKELVNDSAWHDSNVFYREYMSNPMTPFFVDMDDILPDFEKACDIVRKSDGMVFLPHIFEYRDNSREILKHILKNYKIDGIECYYRNFTIEQTNYLLDICKKNNLYISGGSDYHGRVKPHIHMGTGEGSLCVPNEIVKIWGKTIF